MFKKARRRFRSYRSDHQFDHPILFFFTDIAFGAVKVLLVLLLIGALYFAIF